MRRTSFNTPLEIYHGVPDGWTQGEIIAAYRSIGGKALSNVVEASEQSDPDWLADRYDWLQYRDTIRELPDLIRLGDSAAIEMAIRYIELNYFGSYSGFLRERLARALKHAALTKSQQRRLISHFAGLIATGQCLQEFREYSKLAKHISVTCCKEYQYGIQ